MRCGLPESGFFYESGLHVDLKFVKFCGALINIIMVSPRIS